MASLTRWTWVSVNSGSWWWTGRPGMLRFMGSQRVGHDWATELNWTEHKGFSIVNEAEVDVFLEFSCFVYDPADVGNLISGSSAFSKSILNVWKFSGHIVSKPSLENFEHYFASLWDECSCAAAAAFFGIAFFGIEMKTDLFQSCGHCWVFQMLSYWV